MKEIKIKLKERSREVKLCFVQNKQVIGAENRYINSCIVCKKTTINQTNFGEQYICSECLQNIKEKCFKDEPKDVVKSVKVRTRKKRIVQKKEVQEVSKYARDLSVTAKLYSSSIRIIDYTKYKNLMSRQMKERTATTIIDLILKGNNTVSKVAKAVNSRRKETIYSYFVILTKAGMLCPVSVSTKGNRYTRLYRVNSTLEYVNI